MPTAYIEIGYCSAAEPARGARANGLQRFTDTAGPLDVRENAGTLANFMSACIAGMLL